MHIWTNGDQDETDAAYERFYNSGADGVMTSDPSRLRAWVDAHGHHCSRMGETPCPGRVQCPTPPETGGPSPSPQPTPTPKSKCKKSKSKRSAASAKQRKCGKKKHKKHKRR